MPVALYGRIGVLQLNELMTHEGPGGEVVGVQLEGSLEVGDCLLVLGTQGVVVANHAAGLGAVPVKELLFIKRALKAIDGILFLGMQGVVAADHAACLGAVSVK